MANRSPHVLFIDDDESIQESRLRALFEQYGVEVRLRDPEGAILGDLQWADLAVVDYFLTSWPERDEVNSIARSPYDGLAAIASMRSILLPSLEERTPGTVPSRPVAFALWSGHLAAATFELPEVVREHVFARANGLEWTFDHKAILDESAGRQIAILAHAVTGLPDKWPSRNDGRASQDRLWSLLDLQPLEGEEASWRHQAQEDVLDCRPPLNELSERSHGLVLLRWLLHRILPYPCFLLDEQQLRARLRVDMLTRPGMQEPGGSPLLEALKPYEYSGLLGGFDGPRWWRSGVEDWLYNVTEGRAGDAREVARVALSLGADRQHEWLRPVVVTTGDLGRSEVLVEVEETVRIRPDDWPPYADDAFARITDVHSDRSLAVLVDPADRYLLTGEEQDQ